MQTQCRAFRHILWNKERVADLSKGIDVASATLQDNSSSSSNSSSDNSSSSSSINADYLPFEKETYLKLRELQMALLQTKKPHFVVTSNVDGLCNDYFMQMEEVVA